MDNLDQKVADFAVAIFRMASPEAKALICEAIDSEDYLLNELTDERAAHRETRAALDRCIAAMIQTHEVVEGALNAMTCAGAAK